MLTCAFTQNTMWQRLQTVFLVLMIISLIASILFPIWRLDLNNGNYKALYVLQYTEKIEDIKTVIYWPFAITATLIAAAITLGIIEIRRYDNRMLQMKMGAFNSLLLAGCMVCAVVFANQLVKENPDGWKYGLGLYLPGVAVVLNLLANRFIRRDEKIVRDSERIR